MANDMHQKNVKHYETLYAIMSRDKKGNEGICVFGSPIGALVMVTGEEKNLENFLAMAKEDNAAKQAYGSGLEIVLAEFTRTKTMTLDKVPL